MPFPSLPGSWPRPNDQTLEYQNPDDSQTDHPAARGVPVMDRAAGVVFPYRGQEQHGVEVVAPPWQMGGDQVEYDADRFMAPDPDPEPIPVRIVQEGSNEIRAFRMYQTPVDSVGRIITGTNERRSKCRVRNLDAAKVVYVSHDLTITPTTGYPILAGTDLEIEGEAAVYCISGDGTQVNVAVMLTLVIAES
jgi:hypothetical protein